MKEYSQNQIILQIFRMFGDQVMLQRHILWSLIPVFNTNLSKWGTYNNSPISGYGTTKGSIMGKDATMHTYAALKNQRCEGL